MTGHTASIYSLAFSEESSLLVSGGADWTVRCWDVKSPGGSAKHRENGSMSNGDSVATMGYNEGESHETLVLFKSNQLLSSISDLWYFSNDLMSTFPTKRTPVINVQFTPRNLCLVAGIYQASDSR